MVVCACAAGAVTTTATEADLELSATLVAVTLQVPPVFPAVNNPLALMVPHVADQVTAVFTAPVTAAVNCCVPPVCKFTPDVGLVIATVTTETATATEADLELSATLVAMMVQVLPSAFTEAVNNPLASMVPQAAGANDQVTPVFTAPVTVAVNCCDPPSGSVTDVGLIVTTTLLPCASTRDALISTRPAVKSMSFKTRVDLSMALPPSRTFGIGRLCVRSRRRGAQQEEHRNESPYLFHKYLSTFVETRT